MPTLPPHPDILVETTETVWSGRFPLQVVKFRQRRFDGAMSGLRTWELWRRGRAAALLPYDPWADQVVLIEQFRLPALAAGVPPVMVEIPAGLCEPNEDPLTTIKRETREEMRLDADLFEPIADVVLTPGGADERCTMYAGRVRAPAAGPDGLVGAGGLASENEDIRVRVHDAPRAIAAAIAGQFPNSVTTIALLWLAARRTWLRDAWS